MSSRPVAHQSVRSLQHPHAPAFLRELQRHHGALAFLTLKSDLAPVVAHDALDNHQTESVAVGFRRVIRFEKADEVFLFDAAAGVSKKQIDRKSVV